MRANETVLVLLLSSSFFLTLVMLYSLIADHPHVLALIEVVSIPFLLFKNYFGVVLKMLDGKQKPFGEIREEARTKHGDIFKTLQPILMGLLIAAPVAFMLVSLFAKADPVFESMIKNIVGQKFLENMLWRSVMSVIFFGITIPLIYMKRSKTFHNPINKVAQWSFITEYSVVMSMVTLIIGLFLIVQWRYIFIPSVAGVNLSQFGVQTYSEYVNRGFNELITASIFIFGLIWTGLILMRTKTAQQIVFLKAVQFVVMAEFVVLILSVFRRILLYQHYHGLSLIRFYGGYFLVVLLAFTGTLFLRHIAKFRFVILELFVAGLSIIGLALFNVERYIALSHPPTVNNRIDFVYLSRMSSDGIDGWKLSYDWTKQVLQENYPVTSTISAEQRRQIAYAGITLEQLLSRYHELVTTQGSEQEQQEYYREIHQFLLQQNEQEWQRMDTMILIPGGPIGANGTSSLQDIVQYKQRLTSAKEKIQRNLQKIENKEFVRYPTLVEPQSTLPPWFSTKQPKVIFNDPECVRLGLCATGLSYNEIYPNSFYDLYEQNENDRKKKEVDLDRILSWQPAKELALQQLKKDIPLTNLLNLQLDYFRLSKRIGEQTEFEQDYDADISLNTPFLKPVYKRRENGF